MPVTTSGVSAANVVATIDGPASHHGTARPDRKNSAVLPRARAAGDGGLGREQRDEVRIEDARLPAFAPQALRRVRRSSLGCVASGGGKSSRSFVTGGARRL